MDCIHQGIGVVYKLCASAQQVGQTFVDLEQMEYTSQELEATHFSDRTGAQSNNQDAAPDTSQHKHKHAQHLITDCQRCRMATKPFFAFVILWSGIQVN